MALSKEEIEKITNENYDDIYKYCISRCGSIDDASDITQEAFLALLKKADLLENTNISLWLYKTVQIEIKKFFRIRKNEDFVSFEDELCFDETICISRPVTEEEFEQLLSKTQKKILEILTEDERSIFIKLYIEKKRVSVISDELGITPNNIYVKSHRIKKKAKKVISTLDLLICVLIFK